MLIISITKVRSRSCSDVPGFTQQRHPILLFSTTFNIIITHKPAYFNLSLFTLFDKNFTHEAKQLRVIEYGREFSMASLLQ